MKRTVLLCLIASPVFAQTLTVTANWTFNVDTALPAANGISASGTVTLGCSPCAVSANSQHFGFGNVQLLYANELTSVASGSAGNQGSSLMTSFTYSLPNLLPGSRLVPRLNQAQCWCGNRAETSNIVTEDKAAITINPYLDSVSVRRQSGSTTYANDMVPVGVMVTVSPTCAASPKGSEQVRIKINGAGVDSTTDFAADALNNNVQLSFQTPGTVTITCSLEPYGSVSNAQTITVVAASGGTGGGSSGGTGGGSGGGSDSQPHGCSSAGGICAVMALAGLLRRSRRSGCTCSSRS